MDAAVEELVEVAGVSRARACALVGRPRASHYRARTPPPSDPVRAATAPPGPEAAVMPAPVSGADAGADPSTPAPFAVPAGGVQPRALSPAESAAVLAVLHSDRFVDVAPGEVYATLLDEGTYLASVSTMYRLLHAAGEVRERRAQAVHPASVKPELAADGPNQIWSWDITKLHGPAKWTYYYLYVILDIYSRYIVGWMLAPHERANLAELLIADTVDKHDIDPDGLTLHADRGSSMASKPVAFLLADLGVTKSHSRPHVPNDNPYSEAQFKTMKYRPEFPGTFANIAEARAFTQTFVAWYNLEHRHSGIGWHTPASVHYGTAEEIRTQRAATLNAAYQAHPERFVSKPPTPPKMADTSWINKPEQEATTKT